MSTTRRQAFFKRLRLGLLLATQFAITAPSAMAQSNWNVNAAGSWNTVASWSAGVPNAVGASANFNFDLTAARTITVDGTKTLGALTFGDPTTAFFAYTIAAGTPTNQGLVFDQTGSADALITVNPTTSTAINTISAGVQLNDNLVADLQSPNTAIGLNITGIINDGAGSFSITKNGTSGILQLSGNNTYDGGTIINAGRVNATNAGSFGTGAVTINSGGSAFFITSNITNTNNLNIAGIGFTETSGNLGAIRLTATTLAGIVNLTADARITAHGSSGTFTGNITQTAMQNYTLELSNFNAATASTITLNNTTTIGGLSIGPASTGTLTVGLSAGKSITITDATKEFRIGNNIAAGTLTQTFNNSGSVTNPGSLLVGRPAILNMNTGSTWNQTGTMTIAGQGGFNARANINAGSTFTYAGPSLITLNGGDTDVGQGLLVINGGTFLTNQGFQQTVTPASGFASVNFTNNGILKITANVADITTVNGLNPSVQMDVGTGGGTIDTNGFNAGISYGITGAGTLTKIGAGTLTLSGLTTHSGTTLINAGTLALVSTTNNNPHSASTISIPSTGILDVTGVTTFGGFIAGSTQKIGGSGSIVGNVAVPIGAELIPGGTATKGTLTLANNLTLDGGALSFDLNPAAQTIGGGVNDLVAVTGTLDVFSNSSIAVKSLGLQAPGSYTYRLVNYGTLGTGTGTLSLDTSALGITRSSYALSTATAGQVNLNVTAVAPLNLKWLGTDPTNPSFWDLNTTTNWDTGGSGQKYFDQDNITFDDTATTYVVDLQSNFQPSSVTVNNTTNAYTMNGMNYNISGAANLVKNGTNTLTLNMVNINTTGSVTVQGTGTLDLGGGSHSAAVVNLVNGTITGNGVLTMTNSTINAQSGAINEVIAGTNVTLNKTGSGTLSLGLINTFTNSNVVIESGVLNVGGLLGIASSNTIKLGTLGSGTATTVLELPPSNAADQIVLSTPLILSSDAPNSKAIIRTTGALHNASANFNGSITLQNRDLYIENDTNTARLYALSGPISGTGNIHVNTLPGAANRVRITSTANTFTGDVYIDTGMLQISNGAGGTNNVIPNTSNVIMSAGTRIGMGTSDSINALIGGAADPLAMPTPLAKAFISPNVSSSTSTTTLTVGAGNGSGIYHGDLFNTSSTAVLAFVKAGTGVQRLTSADSSYTGATTISGGTLEVEKLSDGGAASSIGSPAATASTLFFSGGNLTYVGSGDSTDKLFSFSASTKISNNGTGILMFSNIGQVLQTLTTARTLTLGGTNTGFNSFAPSILNVSGGTALAKDDAGVWILTAANSYAGGTSVNGGKLLISNTTGSGTGTGPVNVAAGATLGGIGIITGATTVNGIMSPGEIGIGTLTINSNTTWNFNSSWVFDLGTGGGSIATPGTSDLLNITGDFAKGSGGPFTFDFANTGLPGTYKLVDWSGTSLFIDADFSGTNIAGGLSPTFTVDGASSALYVTLAAGGPPQWNGTGAWSTAGNWQGPVPNSLTAVASFLGMGTGGVSVDMPQTVNQLVFNPSNATNYTISGTSLLTIGGTTPTPTITNTAGSNTITAPLSLATGTAINVTAGTLAISPAAANTVGTGVSATVASMATLQLGGTGSGLNATTNVANTGTLSVTGTNQVVGNISGAGSTTVTGAGTSATPTLVAKDIDQTVLTINNGAYVRIAPSGTSTSVVTALTVSTTSNLDISDNDVIVNNPTPVAAASNLTAVATAVNASFAGGNGIVSTTMGSGLETVGFGLNSFLSYPTFNGVAVNDDSVLVKYTYFGDSNLDGFVTDDDLGYFLAGYGSDVSANPWVLGDYNHDGFTTDDDLGFFLAAYGSTPGLAGGGIQAIPEPSTLVLGTLAGLGLGALSLRRRRAKS
jgi:fibronectin-binding autotransporter adhesin